MSTPTSNKKQYGVLAEFRNPKELIDAAKKTNQSGYRKFDTFSPFPIHGMDKAMSLQKSKLGWIVFSHGLVGFVGAVTMIYWMMVVDYPLNISGKTLMNIPAWVPVTFELTVLLSAFGAVFGMFFLNGLPKFNHPLFNSENFKKVTDDGFFLCIEAEDPQFDSEKVQNFLKESGATNIETIFDE